jgi:putative pyruvate formate lyase activating enzyme
MESIKAMHEQVGDLCFTGDGIAKKGVLVRHLVMPGKEDEGQEIVRWLAKNISKDIYVHIMEQYHPRAHVGKPKRTSRASSTDIELGGIPLTPEVRYADINRPVSEVEMSTVQQAAREAGLWRFVEVSEHSAFA